MENALSSRVMYCGTGCVRKGFPVPSHLQQCWWQLQVPGEGEIRPGYDRVSSGKEDSERGREFLMALNWEKGMLKVG